MKNILKDKVSDLPRCHRDKVELKLRQKLVIYITIQKCEEGGEFQCKVPHYNTVNLLNSKSMYVV